MAAAFFNKYADPTKAKAVSAGTEPAERVHPVVQLAMEEIGFDLSTCQPTKLTSALAETASLLVTMGCGEQCPYVAGLKIVDWQLADPKGQGIAPVREIRDRIETLVAALVAENGWGADSWKGRDA